MVFKKKQGKSRNKGRNEITLNFGPEKPEKEVSDFYREYMASDEWRSIRAEAITLAGSRCQLCNSPFHLEVHHRTYARFGHEDLSDLTVLCAICHKMFHETRALYQTH